MKILLLLILISSQTFASAFFKGTAGGSGITASTIPGGAVIQTRYHQASVANITAATWIEVRTAANIPSGVRSVALTSTIGQPLEIGEDTVSCNTSTVRKFVINRGDGPILMGSTLTAGSKLCVRSLDATASAGELTLNLMGP